MTDLVEFLRARLDEDEQIARSVESGMWDHTIEDSEPTAARFADRFRPARLLAEVEAKRRILDLYVCSCRDPNCADCGACSGGHHADPEPFPCETVKLLAVPYADHPDFDPAWRVAEPTDNPLS